VEEKWVSVPSTAAAYGSLGDFLFGIARALLLYYLEINNRDVLDKTRLDQK
jgi:hypothetical protein